MRAGSSRSRNLFKLVDFCAGSASALAFGVFLDAQDQQRSFFWSEPVRLTGVGTQASEGVHGTQTSHGEHGEHAGQ